ncbi:hypothetical protein CANARDRAFT_7093 [[Candida] arabinofermentans NRRL YB-2248]|uniref:Phosphodiesterase n=1 Tax=[Candida] arabinofermentans NRRL YB-2248 TaxID=983967 RepID=A0A1E4T1V1_9ASCO|nr:hypothetical protein CANARDRAFT_7093 [[Candida] arabinofermentans NRRL YB-2248]
MIAEILVLNTHSTQLPLFVSNSFDSKDTYYKTFTNITSLCIYLSSFSSYILSKKDKDSKVEPISNTSETEFYYPVGIIINSENQVVGKEPLDSLSLRSQKRLLESRFHHLNTTVSIIPFSEKKLDSSFIEELELIYSCTKDRLTRIETWVDLNPKIADLSDNHTSRINTMGRILNDYSTEFQLEEESDFMARLTASVDYRSLLNTPKSYEYYLSIINSWEFPAYNLNGDELLYCGSIILLNAIKKYSPEEIVGVENRLLSLLFYVRDNYRSGNPFHNFRHAIDVLQATNYFIDRIKEDVEFQVQLDGRTVVELLFASLGHDLGHPGITNMFLSTNKTPIAISFNDKSVLEKFHFKQFTKIISPFSHKMIANKKFYKGFEERIEQSILATDMGQHDYFVGEIDKFSNYDDESKKTIMLCSLLIKCADISNVCRPLKVSVKWGLSLGEEFKEVALLENFIKFTDPETKSKINISPICPPEVIRDIDAKKAIELVPGLAGSQMFFITRFAYSFFSKIGENIPALIFLKNQLVENIDYWESLLDASKKA